MCLTLCRYRPTAVFRPGSHAVARRGRSLSHLTQVSRSMPSCLQLMQSASLRNDRCHRSRGFPDGRYAAHVLAWAADTRRVADNGYGSNAVLVPRYRRVGLRMSCWPCEVAWTGPVESDCWVCGGPGVPGPPPSIYPDVD